MLQGLTANAVIATMSQRPRERYGEIEAGVIEISRMAIQQGRWCAWWRIRYCRHDRHNRCITNWRECLTRRKTD